MKRSEQADRIEVVCPDCGQKREISKKAYVKSGGDLSDVVFFALDRTCAQRRKTLTEEHKNKISQSLTGYKQTEDHKLHKSEYMLAHPELWQSNIVVAGDELTQEHIDKIRKSKEGKK